VEVNPALPRTLGFPPEFPHAISVEEADVIVESDRDRCRRRVAVFFQIDHHFFHRHAEPLGKCDDDPLVGLVRDDQRDLIDGDTGFIKGLPADLFH